MSMPQELAANNSARLRWGSKFSYASGTLSFSVKDLAFSTFILIYYTGVVGIPGTTAGAVIAISLAWDAISDPIVGSISDNSRTRWGRRHPLMAISGVPLGISLWFVFNVPVGLSEQGVFWWMLISCLALRTFQTLYTVPYLALGAELTTDYNERSSLTGMRTTFGWLSGILLAVFAWGYLFVGADGIDGRLIRANYERFGLIGGALIIAFTTYSTWATAKHIPNLPQGSASPNSFGVVRLMQDIEVALVNRNFRTLFFVLLTLGLATGLSSALGTHVATYFWELTTTQLSQTALFALVPIVLMMACMQRLNARLEKQQVLTLCIVGLALNTLWLVPGRLLGFMPANGTGALFALILLNGGISVALIIWLQTVGSSIIADIADEQELVTRNRQEGVFFAAQSFSIKFVTGIGLLLGGATIDLVGIPANAAPGSLPSDVLFNLGIVMGPVQALLLMVPYFYARQLRTSKAEHARVRSLLDARAATDATDPTGVKIDPAMPTAAETRSDYRLDRG